jgi:hypothetical protein
MAKYAFIQTLIESQLLEVNLTPQNLKDNACGDQFLRCAKVSLELSNHLKKTWLGDAAHWDKLKPGQIIEPEHSMFKKLLDGIKDNPRSMGITPEKLATVQPDLDMLGKFYEYSFPSKEKALAAKSSLAFENFDFTEYNILRERILRSLNEFEPE